MKVTYVYNTVNTALGIIQDIDLINVNKRKANQMAINKVYKILEQLKNDLIRENIKK